MVDELAIREKFELLTPALNERTRRLWTAAEAQVIGRGGISAVARATGMDRGRIARGIKELGAWEDLGHGRIRKKGGGRKRTVTTDPTLKTDLERLVEPATRGDPESPLRWTCKGTRRLAEELRAKGHRTSFRMVAELLHEMDYSLQANRKTKEGSAHPDRNAQFENISRKVQAQQAAGQPVISVDTKKKELVGDFKNSGREWRKKGDPEKVRVHDFMIKELGKVFPYGVYDLTRNAGWVSVGVDHDTAAFAVESIRRWWQQMGQAVYPKAQALLITADCGGSNSARTRLWKWELQRLANETGLSISVSHFPPGTSKWNKIEHRLFSFITQNWRGQPLLSQAAIVSLIASTTTKSGLKVRCQLDTNTYPKGVKVSNKDMAEINLHGDDFHGEWNYTIHPTSRRN